MNPLDRLHPLWYKAGSKGVAVTVTVLVYVSIELFDLSGTVYGSDALGNGWFRQDGQIDVVRQALLAYGLVPKRLVLGLVVVVPAVEAGGGIALLAGIAVATTSFVLAVTVVTFGLAMAANLVRGRRHDCGCFAVSPGRDEISWWKVGRNAALAALLLVSSRQAAHLLPWRSAGGSLPTSEGIGALLTAALILTLWLLSVSVGRVAGLVRRAAWAQVK